MLVKKISKKKLKQLVKDDKLIIDCQKHNKNKIINSINNLLKFDKQVQFINCHDQELIMLAEVINLQDIKKRYEYIYDVVCDYLDEQFQKNNYCQFVNDVCVSGQYRNSQYKEFGCCYIYPRQNWMAKLAKKFMKNQGVLLLDVTSPTICPHLSGKDCRIKALSCKLFTCRYLQKKGVSFAIDDFWLLKKFFNKRQKTILQYSFYHDKEKVINQLLKYT